MTASYQAKDSFSSQAGLMIHCIGYNRTLLSKAHDLIRVTGVTSSVKTARFVYVKIKAVAMSMPRVYYGSSRDIAMARFNISSSESDSAGSSSFFVSPPSDKRSSDLSSSSSFLDESASVCRNVFSFLFCSWLSLEEDFFKEIRAAFSLNQEL